MGEVLVLVLVTLLEVAVEEWDEEMEDVVAVLAFDVPLDDAAEDPEVEADDDDALFAPMEKDPVVA